MNIEIEEFPATIEPLIVTDIQSDQTTEGTGWLWVLWLLAPLLFLLRQLLTLVLWLDIRFIHDPKISQHAKCPACGIRSFHPIQFAEEYGAVIHTCQTCKAEWGQRPIVTATVWKISRRIEEKEERLEDTTGIL